MANRKAAQVPVHFIEQTIEDLRSMAANGDSAAATAADQLEARNPSNMAALAETYRNWTKPNRHSKPKQAR